jgi:hypothetical protein
LENQSPEYLELKAVVLIDERDRKTELRNTRSDRTYRLRRTGICGVPEWVRDVKIRRPDPTEGEIEIDLEHMTFQDECARKWGKGRWKPYTTGGCLRTS